MEGNENNKTVLIILISIIAALVLIIGGLLIKNKMKSNKSDKKETTKTETKVDDTKDTTKDTTNNKTVKPTATTRSAEELLEVYYTAQINGDYGRFLSVLPKDTRVYVSKYIKEADIKERAKILKENYGDDVKVSFDIKGKTKQDESWVKSSEEYLTKDTGKTITISECYAFDGSVTFTGSKGSVTYSSSDEASDFAETWYCNINGEWGLIFG